MRIQKAIESKLMEKFEPLHLEVVNESSSHNVPKGSETHFKVLIVAECFVGQSRVSRQQQVYSALSTELKEGVHALSQRIFTPDEWQKSELDFASPDCLGGSKKSP